MNLYALNITFDQAWVPFIVILSEKIPVTLWVNKDPEISYTPVNERFNARSLKEVGIDSL